MQIYKQKHNIRI